MTFSLRKMNAHHKSHKYKSICINLGDEDCHKRVMSPICIRAMNEGFFESIETFSFVTWQEQVSLRIPWWWLSNDNIFVRLWVDECLVGQERIHAADAEGKLGTYVSSVYMYGCSDRRFSFFFNKIVLVV